MINVPTRAPNTWRHAALTQPQLEFIEGLLRKARERALEFLAHFEESTQESGRGGTGELARYASHPADEGTDTMRHELESTIATDTSDRFTKIEEALELLYNQPARFGTCHECGSAIGFPRLELVPWTDVCELCAAEAKSITKR